MRKINAAMLAEGIVLSLMSVTLFLLSISGAYMYYVTPRTLPYMYFASALFLLLGMYALRNLFAIEHAKHYSHLMIVLIPLLLIVWSVKDTGIIENLALQAQNTANVQAAPSNGEGEYVMKASSYEGTVLHGYDEKNQTIVIPQEEAYRWLVEIFDNPDPFLGYTITTMGQVMKDPTYFDEGCFSPVRQLMTCCAADLYPIGFVCEYANTDSLTKDDWVTVTGKLQMRSFDTYRELRIVVDSVTPSAPANEPYLFSY